MDVQSSSAKWKQSLRKLALLFIAHRREWKFYHILSRKVKNRFSSFMSIIWHGMALRFKVIISRFISYPGCLWCGIPSSTGRPKIRRFYSQARKEGEKQREERTWEESFTCKIFSRSRINHEGAAPSPSIAEFADGLALRAEQAQWIGFGQQSK